MPGSCIVVHCRRDPYEVYIGRGSLFGNPFTELPLSETRADFRVSTRAEAIECYAGWLIGAKDLRVRFPQLMDGFWENRRQAILRRIPDLIGRRLGCYCRPKPCHGDILADMANTIERSMLNV